MVGSPIKKQWSKRPSKKKRLLYNKRPWPKKWPPRLKNKPRNQSTPKEAQKKEASDLEILQRTVPNVKAGNDRSYFLNVSRGDGAHGAFVIGRIDGFDHTTDTIYELKSRSSRLFHRVCEYEEIQCLLYAKMLRKEKIVLVGTYRGEQLLYPMRFHNGKLGNLIWQNIQRQLEQVVQNLNRIEEDENYRQKIINILF
jgi:hypothetical protein